MSLREEKETVQVGVHREKYTIGGSGRMYILRI
jgi:hypothetical protein